MKKIIQKPLFSLIVMSLLSCANLGYADDEKCLNMAGTWDGSGKVKVLFFTCEYNVLATVQNGNPANATVTVSKKSGSFLCTKNASENVVISCKGNSVEIKSDKINATGTGSDDGKTVSLSGNIHVMSKDYPLNLQLYRRTS